MTEPSRLSVLGRSRLTAASLCTGYGGLDKALGSVLGTHLIWLAENAPAPSLVAAERFTAPNLGDLTKIDWTDVERPDVLTAGYPCQPFSAAGKGKGSDDHRHLWPHVRDAIRDLRPGLVVLENVANHLRIGFREVLADLAALGFDAEWTLLRASDVGACHRRARVFVVAYPRGGGWDERTGLRRGDQGEHGRRLTHDDGGKAPADSAGERRADVEDGGDCPTLPLGALLGTGGRAGARHLAEGVVVDRRGARVVAWGVFEPAIRRHERVLGREAPYPLDGSRLSARFVEWMMMLDDGWVTDLLSRNAAITVLGNGVVPPAAECAVRGLLARVSTSLEVAA